MAFENFLKRHGRNQRRGPDPSFEHSNMIGVNYADSIYAMLPNQSPHAINADFGKRVGTTSKRDGFESLITSLGAGKMTGLHAWQHSTGDQMLAAWDKNLYLLTGTAGSVAKSSQADWEAFTLTDIDATTSAGDIKLPKGTDFSEVDTLTADFDGTHSDTVASNDAVILLTNGSSYTDDVCSGGTAISSGSWYNRDNVFDNNQSTAATGEVPDPGDYIGYDFGSGVTKHIRRIRLQNLSGGYYPSVVKLIKSNDLYNWTVVQTLSITLADQTFDISESSAARCWAVVVDTMPNNINWILREIEMMAGIDAYPSSGVYTHTEQDPSGAKYANAFTITYDKTTPANTSLDIEIAISADGGATYGEWTAIASGASIAVDGTDLSDYRIMWRANLANTDGISTPLLNDVTVAATSIYEPLGSGVSLVYDLTNTPISSILSFTQTVPAGTTVTWYARGSSNNTIFGDWLEVLNSGDAIPLQRYIQIMFVLATTDPAATPTVSDFLISYSSSYTTPNKLDIGPLQRTSDLLTGNRVCMVNYEDWLLCADGLRPWLIYITTDAQTTGTAQGGAAGYLTLADGFSAVDDFYNNAFITLTGGTGAGQVRWIEDHDGSTGHVIPSVDFGVVPDETTTYSIGSAVKVRQLGVNPPTVALTSAAGAAGLLTGNYYWKYTFVNADEVESNPGPASTVLALTSDVASLTVPVDASAGNTTAKRRIYRTVAGGSVYKYVAEIADNATTSYTDSTTDAALGSLMLDNNNIPPAVCTMLYQFTSYVFYVDGYDMWFSKAGAPDQVPNISGDIQDIIFPGKVADIKAHPTALVVSGEPFIATITSNSGFILDSDPTVDTTTMKVIDNNGGLSFEASAMCLSPSLRSTLILNTNTGLRATVPGLQDNSIESVPLSRNIQPYYERSINRDQAAGVFFNNYYLYSMEHQPAAGAASERLTFVYDLRTEQWYGPWTFGMSCYAISKNALYAGDADNGKIYRMFTGSSDAGDKIKMVVDYPMRAPAGENGTCKFKQLLPIVSADSDTTALTIKPKVDNREATITPGALTSTFTGDIRPGHNFIRPKKFRIALPQGNTYSIRIEDDSINPLEIEKIITEYEVLSVSR